MANVKKGLSVKSPEWWKHLRKEKRTFWKKQRKADRSAIHTDQDQEISIEPSLPA